MSADEVVSSVQRASTHYIVSAHTRSMKANKAKRGSLVDRGANGGILGDDAHVIFHHQRTVDVTGIDNHEMTNLKIVDASTRVTTQLGPVILILRQYAYHGTGRSIHSCAQIEAHKNMVDDRSMRVGGTQCIRTVEGYVIPLDIIAGLPHMKMFPNTSKEWDELPHVILTSGDEWNPRILDNTITDSENWFDKIDKLKKGLMKTPFDAYGNFRDREPVNDVTPIQDINPAENFTANFHQCFEAASNLNLIYVPTDVDPDDPSSNEAYNTEVKPTKVDYNKYRPYFLHVPLEKIRNTFQNTTQHAVNVISGHNILQTIQSPYPAHNVWRRNEAVASDTIYAEVPAVCTNGHKAGQIFVGRKSLVIDLYSMGTTKEFVNTLEDQIRKRGAMDKLITDSARVEISGRVKDVLRALLIDDWQSEPQYQHQNFAEHRWRALKRNINWFMNYRNVDANAWFLCAMRSMGCRCNEPHCREILGMETTIAGTHRTNCGYQHHPLFLILGCRLRQTIR